MGENSTAFVGVPKKKSPPPGDRAAGFRKGGESGLLHEFRPLMGLDRDPEPRFVPPIWGILMRIFSGDSGRNLRFVMLVTCVPIAAALLGTDPLRLMMAALDRAFYR